MENHIKPTKEEIINRAFQFHLKGNVLEAAKNYQIFIDRGFKDYRVFSNYGVILKDSGDLKRAESYTRSSIALHPNFAISHSNLGGILMDLGKLEEAKEYYEKAIEIDPNCENTYANLGAIHSNLGNFKEAKIILQKAIELNPNCIKTLTNIGSVLRNTGNLKEAEFYTMQAIKINPMSAIAHSNLGNILRDQQKLRQAEKSTRKAIQLDPELPTAHSNLGGILIELGNFKEAEKFTRNAIKLDPNLVRSYSNLVLILKNNGHLEEAEKYARKAIKLKPNLAEAYCNLGGILNDLGKFEEANKYTSKAIKLDPALAIAYSNLGNILRNLGSLHDAELSARKAIELDPNCTEAFANLGAILSENGNLKDGEVYTRKAIDLNPNSSTAHSNLGNILRDLGDLKEAELSILKAIDLNPNFAKGYYYLSTFNYSMNNRNWLDKLFSEKILMNKSAKDKVDIYFARANILHKEKNFQESANSLKLANQLKLSLCKSQFNELIQKSQFLLKISERKVTKPKETSKHPQHIFIVGMPRSGSTLVESILSMNSFVNPLGELNILEKSFQEWSKIGEKKALIKLYSDKLKSYKALNITTNKWLYNYLYAGIIASHLPNAKIIHCYRNPLDNILSIYRAHFANGNEYSSSLEQSTKVYLNQARLMDNYKKRFRSKIYDLNYDLLVVNPKEEIKSLINWLGWEWHDSYLSPHLSTRVISTRSSVEVRSPINSKSIGGWKNYRKMLKPVIDLLAKEKFKYFF